MHYFFQETFKRVLLIEAKVPIINLMVPKYGIEVDISCNTIEGIRNTHLLRSYALLDWRVRPLVVTVKAWARSKGINDSKDNSFSSYTLALMVIHFLQCKYTLGILIWKFTPFFFLEIIDFFTD